MLKHVLVMMLLAPRALVWGASDEATSGNGLEADSTTSLNVLIEVLSQEEKKIGLTRERIEARVNQSLRKAGITPVPLEPKGGFRAPGGRLAEDNLYVNVNVSASGCFAISIEFQRRVFYRSGGKWFTMIGRTTWSSGGTGIAHGDADYILDRIAQTSRCSATNF